VSELPNICVVGAGFMGTQIGLQCAAHGMNAHIVDPEKNARTQSELLVNEELEQRVKTGQISADERNKIRAHVRYTDALENGIRGADLVIEAIPERLELKRQLFAKLDTLAAPETILASNSSSIKISAIENATKRLDKVLNLHFYGVIWERPMVELMRGSATTDATIEQVYRFAQRIGVTPLVVDKESTGFIFNRVWRAVKRETLHLVDEGVTSHEDVDRAWMIFTGMPMGPFALMDRIGLDVICDIENVYYRESGDERDAPPSLLTDKVERGELGRKAGKGFYTYPNPTYEEPGWLKGAS
jgi:3-hydroxybutyryl-CoA dehydrogenase